MSEIVNFNFNVRNEHRENFLKITENVLGEAANAPNTAQGHTETGVQVTILRFTGISRQSVNKIKDLAGDMIYRLRVVGRVREIPK